MRSFVKWLPACCLLLALVAVPAVAQQSGQTSWGKTSAGSANAQTITIPTYITTVPVGAPLSFIAGITNTGATTLSVNGTAAVSVLKKVPSGLVPLAAGDWVVGAVQTVVYDGTEFQWLSQNTSTYSVQAGGLQSVLATIDFNQFPQVNLQGFNVDNDGGGGPFHWEASSTATTDGCTIFAETGVATGRWVRNLNGVQLTPIMCGAYGDGDHDDTTAVQDWFNYLVNQTPNSYTMSSGFWPRGIYNTSATISVNLGSGVYLPNIYTAGAFATKLMSTASPAISISSTSILQKISQARWFGITIDGTTATGTNIGVQVSNVEGFEWDDLDIVHVNTCARLLNATSSSFTEKVKFRNMDCEFAPVAMQLSVTGGNNSFRSSGMPGLSYNMPQGGTMLLIDAGAHPYMFDLDQATVWPYGSTGTQYLITNNSNQVGNSFIGTMTMEGGPGTQLVQVFDNTVGSTAPVCWSGNYVTQGNQFNTANVTIGPYTIRGGDCLANSNGLTEGGGVPNSNLHTVSATGQTVNMPISGGDLSGYLVSVNIQATNYSYNYLFYAVQDVGGSNFHFTQLANPQSFNGTGWGAPTFTSNPAGLIASNANWTSSTGVSWSYIPFFAVQTVQ